MQKAIGLVFCALALVAASPKQSNRKSFYSSGTTGALFMQICKSNVWQPGNYDPCGSYLLGVIDAYANAGVLCPPEGVKNFQMQQIAFNYVRDHPEFWQYPMSVITRDALAAYKCGAT